MNRLRPNEKCPLHQSFFCCGRARPKIQRAAFHKGPVERVADEFHPRGFRELCTPAELRRRKHVLMATGPLTCLYCDRNLKELEYSQIELCHKEPKGMGGARRDDSMLNLALGCATCNRENGSRRLA